MAVLLEHTAPEARELGVLIDHDTAEVLQIVIGRRRHVELDARIIDSTPTIVVVHTHNTTEAFSADDWATFVATDNADLDIVVTPDATYVLMKTEEFDSVDWYDDFFANVSGRWESLYKRFREEFSLGVDETILRVNVEMAKIYGIEFRSHSDRRWLCAEQKDSTLKSWLKSRNGLTRAG